MASPLNAAHQNLPFPPNRTLPSKANAINQALTKSIFFNRQTTDGRTTTYRERDREFKFAKKKVTKWHLKEMKHTKICLSRLIEPSLLKQML